MISHLIKKLLFTLSLVFISYSAVAEWTHVSDNFNNYSAKSVSEFSKMFDETYVDYATIQKEGNMVKMWSLTNFGNERELSPGIKFLSTKSLEEFDCKEELVRYLHVSAYSKNMGGGEPVYIEDTPSLKWNQVPPKSVIKGLWEIACGQTEEDKIKSEKSKIDFMLYKGMLKFTLDPDVPPPQEEWIEIQPFHKSKFEKYYFHPVIYKKNSQLIQVWKLVSSAPTGTWYAENSSSTLMKSEYDCKNERYRSLYMSYNKSVWQLVNDRPSDIWSPVKSGLFEDYLIDIVCDKRG